MEQNILLTHLTGASVFGYLLDYLRRSEKYPWINNNTQKLNFALRAILSFFTTIGIHWAWNGTWTTGRTILISIPALSVLLNTVWYWAGQFALQHGFERILDVGRTWRLDPKVFNDLVDAIAQRLAQQNPPAVH